MAVKFEIFSTSPGFPIRFRKGYQISKDYLKRSKTYAQKPLGDPPWNEYLYTFFSRKQLDDDHQGQ